MLRHLTSMLFLVGLPFQSGFYSFHDSSLRPHLLFRPALRLILMMGKEEEDKGALDRSSTRSSLYSLKFSCFSLFLVFETNVGISL